MKENTTETYLRERRWKSFLMSLPLDRPRGYLFANPQDLATIRVRAAQISTDADSDRRFTVSLDYNASVATITATLKEGAGR